MGRGERHADPRVCLDGRPGRRRCGGGQVFFVRTDHIGRPVFATDATGAKVWEASYLPFGGVRTTVGSPIALRFPGQSYQAESGLHQNWMRDYDPTAGRYLQADPLGLVDGASVYGYALQNPGRYTDPTGEFVPLFWILGGLLIGEVVEYLYDEYCECNPYYPVGRYTTLGAVTEVFGPTHPKRFRPFGGSRAHSSFSYLMKIIPDQGRRGAARRAGQAVAKRIPYVGFALLVFDGGRLLRCFLSRESES